jgi:hypothetical protein
MKDGMNRGTLARVNNLATVHSDPAGVRLLQRKCDCGQHTVAGGECDECKNKQLSLQRHANGSSTAISVPPIVHDVLRSPGQPLDAATRAFFEPRLGCDFSQVRVHTDAKAVESTQALSALAFNVGRNVVFGTGQYAPRTVGGAKLLAHELTHVAQQATGRAVSQPARAISSSSDAAEVEADFSANQIMSGGRVTVTQQPSATVHALSLSKEAVTGLEIGGGVLGAVGAGLGIAWLAGAFDKTTFTDDELKVYLKGLEKGHIEGKTVSDNKARAVVQRWQAGQSGFSILTVPIRVLLIQEMASGYLSGDDQKGILALLRDSIPSELVYILPKIGIDALKARFDGEARKQIDAIIEQQDIEAIGFGADWTVEGVKKVMVRHGDKAALKTIVDRGYKIIRFEQAFEKWEYADGSIRDEEITGLKGNTDKARKEIRLFKAMPNEKTASVLFHELDHVVSGVEGTEGEIHARVEAEKFGIRHGLPEAEPGYRKPDGTIDEAKIRAEIGGSSHYSPDPAVRHRVPGGRRYVGEVEVPGWEVA